MLFFSIERGVSQTKILFGRWVGFPREDSRL